MGANDSTKIEARIIVVLLTGIVIYLAYTAAPFTKQPTDVFHRVEQLETRLLNQIADHETRLEGRIANAQSKVTTETAKALSAIGKELDSRATWMEIINEKMKDRFTGTEFDAFLSVNPELNRPPEK